MRIIGGRLRNKKIITEYKGIRTTPFRPTTAKARAAVFNLLLHSPHCESINIDEAVIADICCGSGAFGLEALSRGAKEVVFLDKSKENLKLVNKNVTQLNLGDNKIYYVPADATKALTPYKPCNVVYIDPPYQSQSLASIVTLLVRNNWLADNHIIFGEQAANMNAPELQEVQLLEERTYGNAKILMMRKKYL